MELTELCKGPEEGASWVNQIFDLHSRLGHLEEAPLTFLFHDLICKIGVVSISPSLGIFGLCEGQMKCSWSCCPTGSNKNPKSQTPPRGLDCPQGNKVLDAEDTILLFRPVVFQMCRNLISVTQIYQLSFLFFLLMVKTGFGLSSFFLLIEK